tara:strand:- start:3325 stop:4026 length:702 start_codon:yes stop_codon:yes gene_type:complete
MSVNEKECLVQIQKGIELQKENIVEACNCFQRAYQLNPFNKEVFINLGKAFMGMGQYELSMKSFLTYTHFLLFENKSASNSFDQNFYLKNYEFDDNIDENVLIVNSKETFINSNQGIATSSFGTKYVSQIQGTNLTKIVQNLELTANIGMCYITKHQSILKFHKIPESQLINELKFIHKRNYNGEILRTSEFGPMIRTIGIAFLAKNLLTSPELSLEDIVQIYYSNEYTLDNL